VGGIKGAGVDNDALLPMPAEHHLRWRLAVLLCDLGNIGVFTHVRGGVPGGAARCREIRGTDWRVAIKRDVVLLAEIDKVVFVPIRMELNLLRDNANKDSIL
jgi:hypothetical protein